MKPKTFIVNATAGGTTYSPVFVVDSFNDPINIGIGVVVSGSVIYDVQHTYVDPRTTNLNDPASATWYNNATLASAAATLETTYTFPVAGIRAALRAGSGQITVTLIQAGPMN